MIKSFTGQDRVKKGGRMEEIGLGLTTVMMVIFPREVRIIMCKEMYLVSIISIKEVFVGPVN